MQKDRPARRLLESEQRRRHLGATRSHQAGESQDFSLAQRERHVLELSRDRQPFDAQRFLARARIGVPRKVFRQRTTDHHLHEIRLGERRRRPRRDVPSVAQHGHRVAQPEDLRHAMRDVDTRHATLLEALDQLEQPLRFRLTEAARRFVEHDDARAAADRRGDLHHLTLPDRQLAERLPDVHPRAGLRQQRFGAPPHLVAIDDARARRQRGEAEVLGNRQVVAERELLVHHPHAGGERVARAAEVNLRSVHEDAAAVRLVNARDDFAERALPRPVLAAERVTGPCGDLERDVGERLRAGKALADAVEPDRRLGHCFVADGSARYLGSTSVNPHSFSWRAQSPRFAFVTGTSSIGMIGFVGCLLSCTFSNSVVMPVCPHR